MIRDKFSFKNIALLFVENTFVFIEELVVGSICAIIYAITREKGEERRITPRKARRIRFFTGMKLWINDHCPWIGEIFGIKDYLSYKKKELTNGL